MTEQVNPESALTPEQIESLRQVNESKLVGLVAALLPDYTAEEVIGAMLLTLTNVAVNIQSEVFVSRCRLFDKLDVEMTFTVKPVDEEEAAKLVDAHRLAQADGGE